MKILTLKKVLFLSAVLGMVLGLVILLSITMGSVKVKFYSSMMILLRSILGMEGDGTETERAIIQQDQPPTVPAAKMRQVLLYRARVQSCKGRGERGNMQPWDQQGQWRYERSCRQISTVTAIPPSLAVACRVYADRRRDLVHHLPPMAASWRRGGGANRFKRTISGNVDNAACVVVWPG